MIKKNLEKTTQRRKEKERIKAKIIYSDSVTRNS